jgi:hypothetical protein
MMLTPLSCSCARGPVVPVQHLRSPFCSRTFLVDVRSSPYDRTRQSISGIAVAADGDPWLTPQLTRRETTQLLQLARQVGLVCVAS